METHQLKPAAIGSVRASGEGGGGARRRRPTGTRRTGGGRGQPNVSACEHRPSAPGLAPLQPCGRSAHAHGAAGPSLPSGLRRRPATGSRRRTRPQPQSRGRSTAVRVGPSALGSQPLPQNRNPGRCARATQHSSSTWHLVPRVLGQRRKSGESGPREPRHPHFCERDLEMVVAPLSSTGSGAETLTEGGVCRGAPRKSPVS